MTPEGPGWGGREGGRYHLADHVLWDRPIHGRRLHCSLCWCHTRGETGARGTNPCTLTGMGISYISIGWKAVDAPKGPFAPSHL